MELLCSCSTSYHALIKINRYAIFGGSFDPIHRGHLLLINAIEKSGLFSKIVVVPAGQPWQRPTIASAQDRLAMVQSAITNSEILVSDCEVKRNAPSYAIETVRELQNEFGSASFSWVIGSDALSGLESWHEIKTLSELVDFLVIVRPGYRIDASTVPSFIRWQELEIGALDISATEIRRALQEHRDISAMVTEPVLRYIQEKRLYGAA